uniref:Uncharacterized protein n=1 Tax=Parascaris equorum TaxID=6256 RepID=A0A914R9Q3_PAREQ
MFERSEHYTRYQTTQFVHSIEDRLIGESESISES